MDCAAITADVSIPADALAERAAVSNRAIRPSASAIAERRSLKDSRLESLRKTVDAIVENRGWISEQQVQEFLTNGYTRAQLLDIVVGVSMKTLSNYVNHVSDPPLG